MTGRGAREHPARTVKGQDGCPATSLYGADEDVCLANIASGQKSIDVGGAGRHSTKRCEPSSGRVLRSDRLGRRVETSCSRLWPYATNSACSLVRISASAELTGCFGSC